MQVIYVDFLNFKPYRFAAYGHIRCVARCAQMFMREDVAHRRKFGRIPLSLARPEKFVRFLLAATSSHVQVMLGWTKTGKKPLRRKAKYKSIEDKASWVFMLLRLEVVG